MTSAPKSAIIVAINGPANIVAQSITRSPWSGPGVSGLRSADSVMVPALPGGLLKTESSCCGKLMLRQAQHERENFSNFKLPSAHPSARLRACPEPVEG